MISALHLLWIVPCSAVIGYFASALMEHSKDEEGDRQRVKRQYGIG